MIKPKSFLFFLLVVLQLSLVWNGLSIQTVNAANELDIGDVVLLNRNNEPVTEIQPLQYISASVHIVNQDVSEQKLIIVVALCDSNNAIISLSCSEKTIAPNERVDLGAGIVTPDNVEGLTLNVFLWDGLDTLRVVKPVTGIH